MINNLFISEGSKPEAKEIKREREESESDQTNRNEIQLNANLKSRKKEIEIIKSNEEIKISEE